ncbi:hypothetical protein K2X33_07725 [bacterium]|nr:hypothetical protein [bacterium]
MEKHSDLYEELLKASNELDGPMGAVAFAVLEMFRRGGLPQAEVQELHEKMKLFFMRPSNAECNAILKMVETRLKTEKEPDKEIWYS